ncbi:hypothetical protein [Umezawaea sp.]|uniref:hypothetical protein n=1 Tax=Umezawaea sp. TaxID=1955258 RepID=UPI002ED5F1A4
MEFPAEAARRERAAVLATVEGVTDAEFDSAPTLCAGRAPGDVPAHVIGTDRATYREGVVISLQLNRRVPHRRLVPEAGRASGRGPAVSGPREALGCGWRAGTG